MQRRIIGLLGMVMICGMLMGMSSVQVRQPDQKAEESEQTEDVKETSEEAEGKMSFLELHVKENLKGNPPYYRENIVVNLETDGDRGLLDDVQWQIRYDQGMEASGMIFSGGWKELEESSEQTGIQVDQYQLTLTREGRYEIQGFVADDKGHRIETKVQQMILDKTAPDFSAYETSHPENGYGIYNQRETVAFTLKTDEVISQTNCSGVDSFYCIVTDRKGYQQTEEWKMEEAASMVYQPDLSLFADGEIQLTFYATDRAGNKSERKNMTIQKDSVCPVITGRMETSGHRRDDYYSGACQIYLFVQDDHLDTSWVPTVNPGSTQNYSFSGWQKKGNVAEGILTFQNDGKYQVTFACQDLAGNQSETLVVPAFTIDQTAPVIEVSYDDQDVQNEKYYHHSRKAVISIREENFRPEDGRITMTLDNTESEATSLEWKKTSKGYQTEVFFPEEGIQALTVNWTDPAGNTAKTYQSGAFVIDYTKPEVKIQNIGRYSSNNGEVAPVVCVKDANMNEGEIKISLEELTGKKIRMPQLSDQKISEHEARLKFENFGEDMDGIYQLSVCAVDLAGNQTEDSVFFTVNRNGSYYAFGRETESMLQKVFIRKPSKVIIYEQNMDWLTESSVILSYNGHLRELKKDEDYTVQVAGSDKKKKEYTYTMNEKCFKEEGTYLLYIDSKDRASNHSSIEDSRDKVSFIVDRTAPDIRMINLEEQQYYHEPSHNFQVTVDDNSELDSVSYYLNGELEENFSQEEIEDMEGLIELQTKASEEYQTIQVIVKDKAGNVADSGEWHVLVNTSERTKKANKGISNDQGQINGRAAVASEDKLNRGKRWTIMLAAAACVLFIGCMTFYRYMQKKKVSIRRLPDTDDRR